jgi:hypothetical protein
MQQVRNVSQVRQELLSLPRPAVHYRPGMSVSILLLQGGGGGGATDGGSRGSFGGGGGVADGGSRGSSGGSSSQQQVTAQWL